MIGRMILVGLLAVGLAGATQLWGDVDWSRGGGLWMQENGKNVDQWFVGVVTLTLDENGVYYYRDTLCVDLFTDIDVDEWYQTELLTPADVGTDLERVAWLIDNEFPSVSDPQAVVEGEAIQLAVWDIIVDGGNGFSSGNVQFSSDLSNPTPLSVQALAIEYEALSFGKSSNDAYVYQNSSIPSGAPAQMLEGPKFEDNGPTPAPEPSTFVLGGVGLAGAAWLGRRKRTN